MKQVLEKNPLVKILLLQLIFFILLTGGCRPFSPDQEQSVTIEISPITRAGDRQEVLAKLRGMIDQASHSIHIQSDRNSMRLTLSPVKDVQAFARRITFGHVREIKNRIIIVEYPENKVFI